LEPNEDEPTKESNPKQEEPNKRTTLKSHAATCPLKIGKSTVGFVRALGVRSY